MLDRRLVMATRAVCYSAADGQPVVVDGRMDVDSVRAEKMRRAGEALGSMSVDTSSCPKMSSGVRKRLQRTVGRYNRAFEARPGWVVVLVVLTYGGQYPSPREAKAVFDTWTKRFRRRWPEAVGIWSIEAQRRGAVHHNLILAVPYPGGDHLGVVDEIRGQWLAVSGDGGSSSAARERHGVHAAVVGDLGGASSYLVSELAKAHQKDFGDESPGNWVGVINRAGLRAFEVEPVCLDLSERVLQDRLADAHRLLYPMAASVELWPDGPWGIPVGSTWSGAVARWVVEGTPEAWQDLVDVAARRGRRKLERAVAGVVESGTLVS